MGMLLLATVYAFSIILAVFLVGLAAGGAAASWLIRRMRADLALGICQLLLTLGIAWTAGVITEFCPSGPTPSSRPPIPGRCSCSISSAARLRFCRLHFYGARVSRWHAPPPSVAR